jgi:hypothetical protein
LGVAFCVGATVADGQCIALAPPIPGISDFCEEASKSIDQSFTRAAKISSSVTGAAVSSMNSAAGANIVGRKKIQLGRFFQAAQKKKNRKRHR